MTAADIILASCPLLLLRDGGWLREGVARRHGRRRNPARKPPRSSLRSLTNRPEHTAPSWVEKCGRSIKGSDTPQLPAELSQGGPLRLKGA